MVDTSIFETLPDGKTKLTQVSRFPSVEALDGMVSTGMEMGQIAVLRQVRGAAEEAGEMTFKAYLVNIQANGEWPDEFVEIAKKKGFIKDGKMTQSTRSSSAG